MERGINSFSTFTYPSHHAGFTNNDPQIRKEVGSLVVYGPRPLYQLTLFRLFPLISIHCYSPVLFRKPTRVGQNILKVPSLRYEHPLILLEYRNLNLIQHFKVDFSKTRRHSSCLDRENGKH